MYTTHLQLIENGYVFTTGIPKNREMLVPANLLCQLGAEQISEEQLFEAIEMPKLEQEKQELQNRIQVLIQELGEEHHKTSILRERLNYSIKIMNEIAELTSPVLQWDSLSLSLETSITSKWRRMAKIRRTIDSFHNEQEKYI